MANGEWRMADGVDPVTGFDRVLMGDNVARSNTRS
jgi:hypothetical protein